MKLAVFTSKYPARVATFFERDMRGLIDAGISVDVFPIHPLDDAMWHYADPMLDQVLPRERVHHVVTSHEAADLAAHLIEPGDLVLVKGSRGIRTDLVVERLKAEFA